MQIQSLLAVTDLSVEGDRAVHRAAMLAAQHRALLKIMYAPGDFAGSDRSDVKEGTARLAAEVHKRFDILVKNVSNIGGNLQAVVEEARWVDMLVMSERRERCATAFFLGQPIERLQRVIACPILLVRLEVARGYRRILVAVDFTPESKKLVELAWSLERNAQVQLFHALTPSHLGKLRYNEAPEQAIKTHPRERMRDAYERVFYLTDSSTARRNRVFAAIGRGDAGRQAVIQQEHAEAELLVVGKRRTSSFADFIFGSVAQRVFWCSTGDVLLVPHDLRIVPQIETQTVPVSCEPWIARFEDRRAA
jgi:nucleotide-binding universal stress UspA family protein